MNDTRKQLYEDLNKDLMTFNAELNDKDKELAIIEDALKRVALLRNQSGELHKRVFECKKEINAKLDGE